MNKSLQKELKAKLEEKKTQLKEAIANRGKADKGHRVSAEYLANFPSYGYKDEESATEVADYQDSLSTEESLEESLEKVEGALRRIEEGAYGKCSTCGKDIHQDRLRAYPEALTCVACGA